MSTIYAMGVLNVDFSARRYVKDQRLWQLYKKFEDAEQCVLSNNGDIFEQYYNYALIEEVKIIPLSKKELQKLSVPKQWWYKADYHTDVVISKIEVPEQFKHMCYWWIG